MTDISGIFQLLALVGGLIFLGGIALVVVNVSQGKPGRSGVLLAVVGVVAFILFSLIGQGLLVVGPTQTAVVFNTLSGELETPRGPGIHIIIPGVQVVTLYPISQQNYTMSAQNTEGKRTGDDAVEARSVDGQSVRIDVTVIFAIEPDQVNNVHRQWSDVAGGYSEGLIRPRIRSDVRDVISTFQAEDIYGLSRDEVQRQIEDKLRGALEPFGFTLTSVLVRDINFSSQFTDAIERKQIEEQELQRARTEAERVEAEAVGQANAAIEAARGDAEAAKIRAAGEAERLRLISAQIAANPNLIPYLYVENLTDNVELALIPANTPFLFDLNSFTTLSPDFVPPEVPDVVPSTEENSGE